MADSKIYDLPAAASVAGTDLMVVESNGTTRKATVSQLPAGTATSYSTRPQAYGGKPDGVILTDLVVTSGSKTISSAAAPFTSTAVDAGKLVCWRVGSAVEYGTVATVQSTTQATLVNNANGSVSTDGGPNGNGFVGTDNTAALNAALAAVQAAVTSGSDARRWVTPGGELVLSPGVWCTRALNVLTGTNVTVRGGGARVSYLCSGDTGAWLSLGTFNASESYAFRGNVLNWQFRDLGFINPCHTNGSTGGSRISVAVQDNGNGNLIVQDCEFRGFRYGFAAPYGSDFTRYYGNYHYNCDVGAYFGPGSQQVEVGNVDCSQSREGLVFEGVQNFHVGSNSHFQDAVVSDITVEGKSSGTTRFGVDSNIGGGVGYTGMMVVDGGTWFESNSGNNGVVAPRHVWLNGDGRNTNGYEGLIVRDAYFIAGGTQTSGGTYCFLETNTSSSSPKQPFVIENLRVGGTQINSIVRNSGTATNITPKLVDVYKDGAIALTQGSVNPKVVNTDGTFHGFSSY